MTISNTSPLYYLILINQTNLLPLLLGDILIPQLVRNELLAQAAPETVRYWIKHSPDWLVTVSVQNINEDLELGRGEIEAISLALDLSADLILLDDKEARLAAKKLALNVTGTLGILKFADQENLIDFETAVGDLLKTNFRISRSFLEEVIKGHRQEIISN